MVSIYPTQQIELWSRCLRDRPIFPPPAPLRDSVSCMAAVFHEARLQQAKPPTTYTPLHIKIYVQSLQKMLFLDVQGLGNNRTHMRNKISPNGSTMAG
jgi:hypothetical protein